MLRHSRWSQAAVEVERPAQVAATLLIERAHQPKPVQGSREAQSKRAPQVRGGEGPFEARAEIVMLLLEAMQPLQLGTRFQMRSGGFDEVQVAVIVAAPGIVVGSRIG